MKFKCPRYLFVCCSQLLFDIFISFLKTVYWYLNWFLVFGRAHDLNCAPPPPQKKIKDLN